MEWSAIAQFVLTLFRLLKQFKYSATVTINTFWFVLNAKKSIVKIIFGIMLKVKNKSLQAVIACKLFRLLMVRLVRFELTRLVSATPSRWCVCQFRHNRIKKTHISKIGAVEWI